MNENSPLLRQRLPIDFAAIKTEEIEPSIDLLLKQMRNRLADLGPSAAPRTYDNVLLTLDRLTEPLDFAMALVRHLESVITTPELRAAHNAVQGPVSQFYTSIALDPDLWNAVKAVEQSNETATMAPVHQRFLAKTVSGFRRAGADLDPAGKKRLEEIDVTLTEMTTTFSEHVLDATNAYEYLVTDESTLAGLPESARSAARESARLKGKDGWRFTLQAPSYIAVMTYLDLRETRRQMWEAANARATEGTFDNRDLLTGILGLREEKARLLGYKSFADLVLEERMAHAGAKALEFLKDLREKTEPFFARENDSLRDFGRTLGYDTINPWDVGYIAEKQRLALFDFDEEELRQYFSLDRVIDGMFAIFGQIFGIEIIPEPEILGWDPAVKTFRIVDAKDRTILGTFYTDWFPRENKRGGAWMDSLVTGNPDEQQPHLGLICGNLTPPVGDTPSLLTHREVETIFHEFGHLLHHTLSRVPVKSLCGTNVPWDFVELPSQIMENWCMERPALDQFACHYKTGELIPQALFDKMKRARNFRSANQQMRQLGLGTVDLKLHIEYRPDRDGDVLAYARTILAEYAPAPLPQHYGMIASFTHLFSSPVGYGAGYYSYKWAEVLDADAFSRFQKEGIFNEQTGADFRHKILELGDSHDPADLYREFMGRDADPTALLERSGLLASQ